MASASGSRCLVRGSINIDEFFHLPHIVRPGETISSTRLTRGAGGKGSNQANAVAQAGGKVQMDGCIGEDGVWVRDGLEKAGVDVGRVRVVDGEVTGRAIIQSAADGENSIVLHKGANYHITSTDHSPPLSGITHLLLQNEIPLESTLSYLRAAQCAGVTSIFNPSPMLSASELRDFPWDCLSWLIVNEGELDDLLQALDPERLAAAAGQDVARDGTRCTLNAAQKMVQLRQVQSFMEMGLICTLGAKGILHFAATAEKPAALPAAKVIHGVVDTTGAGDCFAGYFAAGLMRDQELEATLRTCLTACAMCVEKPGARDSVPTLHEVEVRMAQA